MQHTRFTDVANQSPAVLTRSATPGFATDTELVSTAAFSFRVPLIMTTSSNWQSRRDQLEHKSRRDQKTRSIEGMHSEACTHQYLRMNSAAELHHTARVYTELYARTTRIDGTTLIDGTTYAGTYRRLLCNLGIPFSPVRAQFPQCVRLDQLFG